VSVSKSQELLLCRTFCPMSPANRSATVIGTVFAIGVMPCYAGAFLLSCVSLYEHRLASYELLRPLGCFAAVLFFTLGFDIVEILLFAAPNDATMCSVLVRAVPPVFNAAFTFCLLILYFRARSVSVKSMEQRPFVVFIRNVALQLTLGCIPYAIIVAIWFPPDGIIFPEGCVMYFQDNVEWTVMLQTVIGTLCSCCFLFLFISPVMEHLRSPEIAQTEGGKKLWALAKLNLIVSSLVILCGLADFIFFDIATVLHDALMLRITLIFLNFELFVNVIVFMCILKTWMPSRFRKFVDTYIVALDDKSSSHIAASGNHRVQSSPMALSSQRMSKMADDEDKNNTIANSISKNKAVVPSRSTDTAEGEP